MAKVERPGDDQRIVTDGGELIYDSDSLKGLSERCVDRLAELADEHDWETCATILESEGFRVGAGFDPEQAIQRIQALESAVAELSEHINSLRQSQATHLANQHGIHDRPSVKY